MALYPDITPERVREMYAEVNITVPDSDVAAIVQDANRISAEGSSWTCDPEKLVYTWISQELHERDADARSMTREHEMTYGSDLTFDAGSDYLPFKG